MATKELRYGPKGKRETGKWRARVKQNWEEYYLGAFNTKAEAERAEREFRQGKVAPPIQHGYSSDHGWSSARTHP